MPDSKYPHDDALKKILHNHHAPFQELNFLNSVFGFLSRHTKYLSNPGASKKVLSLINSYIEKAKNREISEPIQNNNNNNNSTQESASLSQEDKEKSKKATNLNNNKTNSNVADNNNNNNNIIDSNVVNNNNNDNNNKTIDSNVVNNNNNDNNNNNNNNNDNDSKMPDTSTSTDTSKPNVEQNKPKEEEKNDIKDPINNGGITDRYVWTQTLNDLELHIQIPSHVRSKDLEITKLPKRLKVAYKNSNKPPIIDDELHEEIIAEDASWSMDSTSSSNYKSLTFLIPKKRRINWWKRVFVGDPEIHTHKIEPESSKLRDLDPEMRRNYEQMVFDQNQKKKGLPTVQEQEEQAILAKIKAEHPELKFG